MKKASYVLACSMMLLVQCSPSDKNKDTVEPCMLLMCGDISKIPSMVDDTATLDTSIVQISDTAQEGEPNPVAGTESENDIATVIDVVQSEAVTIKEIHDLDFSVAQYLDECPKGDECYSPFYVAVCLKSDDPELSGFKSICTGECEIDKNGKERVIVSAGSYDGDCDSTLSNGATCCGLAKNPATEEFKHYCLLEIGGSCCYESVYCQGKCCPDGATLCSGCGCLQSNEICCQEKPCDLNAGNICDMCGCHLAGEDCCPGGEICPVGFECAVVGEEPCVIEGSMNCGDHYCPSDSNCLDGADGCCPIGQEICSGECCESWQICNEVTGACMKKPKCAANEVACKYACCKESEICSADENSCEAKCNPPAPNFCFNECCSNNFNCVCPDQGGFCLPEDATMCNCQDKTWCEPLKECIEDGGCHASGEICKPLGAEDCPEAENCYCDPGSLCTSEQPACCPSDTPVPCGDDDCCPADNECLPEIKDCLPPGWDYCSKWKIKCPPGKDCKEKQSGCKNDGETECADGPICAVNNSCVGAGKGENGSGCCPGSNPIACNSYCCPSGTHCEAGCGGCVENGYKCCPNGSTVCLENKYCWSGGACLDSEKQDCGSYSCKAGYVCSNGSQQCCAETIPKTCGNKCCKTYETCYAADQGGVCVDELGGEEYCGDLYKCSAGKNCMTTKGCMPEGAVECESKGYCAAPYNECCGYDEKTICLTPGGTCCSWPPGCFPGIFKAICNQTTEFYFSCSVGNTCCGEKKCMKVENTCCGDHNCAPENACCGTKCMKAGNNCCAAWDFNCAAQSKCSKWPNGATGCCSKDYPNPCVEGGVNKCCK